MSLKIRRVVTGHDAQGRAKVLIDETRQEREFDRGPARNSA